MVTGKQYAQAAWDVYNTVPQVGYIWGTSLVEWTLAKQNALVKKYNSDPGRYSDYRLGALYGKKWIGHKVVDCSGLTSRLARDLGITTYHHGSNSSWNYDCAYKGEKKKGMKLPPGAWVYTTTKDNRGRPTDKHGHIGIVAPDGDRVVEAQGTIKGVVTTKVSDAKWTHWGLGKGIEFDFIPGQTNEEKPVVKEQVKPVVENTIKEPAKTSMDTNKKYSKVNYPTIRRGAKGDLVAQLQTFLSKDGSSLAIDGIFGVGTQSAVKAFQKRHGLTIDGIVGPQTWGKLLELYA